MPGKSKTSAKAIDRPFPAELLRQAKKIADGYQVILHCEEGHWYGRGLELPHVFGDGQTVAACVADTRQALRGAVALMLEEGQRPPTPSRAGTRTMQVNVRLTAEEKVLLESAAKRQGYSALSDFLRAAAIASAR